MSDDEHPLWVMCPCCRGFWCTVHRQHAHDCECPPIDEMTFDPYTTGGEPLDLDPC